MSVISHTHISGNVAICPTCPLKGISAHLYQLDESGQRLAKPLQSLHLSEESGTFFNFNKVDLKKEDFMVEVVTPDQNQSKYVTANSPHKHVTFTFEPSFKSDLETERTHGQLGAALLILILIVSLLVTQGEKIQKAFVGSSSRTHVGNGDGIDRGASQSRSNRRSDSRKNR